MSAEYYMAVRPVGVMIFPIPNYWVQAESDEVQTIWRQIKINWCKCTSGYEHFAQEIMYDPNISISSFMILNLEPAVIINLELSLSWWFGETRTCTKQRISEQPVWVFYKYPNKHDFTRIISNAGLWVSKTFLANETRHWFQWNHPCKIKVKKKKKKMHCVIVFV